jgi:hypothetical protein
MASPHPTQELRLAAATWGLAARSPPARHHWPARHHPPPQGFFDALVKIPAEEGIRAMWKGLLPRLMRIPPGQAIVWCVSDQVVGYVERQRAEEYAMA